MRRGEGRGRENGRGESGEEKGREEKWRSGREEEREEIEKMLVAIAVSVGCLEHPHSETIMNADKQQQDIM